MRVDPELRRRQLRAALIRVAKGRSINDRNSQLSVSSVAREAGVSASLLHNSYPEIVEEIRRRKPSRERAATRPRADRLLQDEVERLRKDMRKLASINETLQLEIQVLCQQLKEGGETSVVSLKGRVRKK